MSSVVNSVVASITLRATMGRKRAFLFAIPPLILVSLTLLLKLAKPSLTSWPSAILGDFGFSVVLPLTALIVGTSVLGAEIDDGSIIHLLATPVRRSSVIVSKFAGRGGADDDLRCRARTGRRVDRDRCEQARDRALHRRAGRVGDLQLASSS